MDKDEFREALEKFTKNNDFVLNPDKKHVGIVIDGVFENEKEFGLKLCPCRLSDGTKEMDLSLICPCNFKIQDIWFKENRCWCGLFVKKK